MEADKINAFLESGYERTLASLHNEKLLSAARQEEAVLNTAEERLKKNLQQQEIHQKEVVRQVARKKVSSLSELMAKIKETGGSVTSPEDYKRLENAFAELLNYYKGDEESGLEAITNKYLQMSETEGERFRDQAEKFYDKRKEDISRIIDKCLKDFSQLEDNYETASFRSPIWNRLEYKAKFPELNYVRLGDRKETITLFGKENALEFISPVVVPFFARNSISIIYKKDQRNLLKSVIDQIFVRSLMTAEAGNLYFYFMDAVGNGSLFLDYLNFDKSTMEVCNRKIFTGLTEIDRTLTELQLKCTDIDQHERKNRSLEEYNRTEKVPIPYRVVIMDAFPRGLSTAGLAVIARLVEYEKEAGVHFVFAVQEEDVPKMGQILPLTYQYRLEDTLCPDSMPADMKERVVQLTNRSFNQDKSVRFDEHYAGVPMWEGDCSNFTQVPLGMKKSLNYDILFDEEAKKGLPSAHTVIAGQTGCGKSSLLHSFIMGTCLKYSPDQVRFFLIDLKGVEFKVFEEYKLPHLDFVALNGSPEYGAHVLRLVLKKMEERMAVFQEKMVTRLPEFRQKFPNEVMPRYFIIIDEYQELFRDLDIARDSKESLERLTSVGRALGFNLILSSQTVELSAQTINNFSHRIAMRCDSTVARQVLKTPDERVMDLKVGQAIINAGTQADTIQSYFLSRDVEIAYLKEIREKWVALHGEEYEENMIVFDRERPALLKNNRTYRKMRPVSNTSAIVFSPGEKIMVDGLDVLDKISAEKNANILALGGNLAVSVRSLNGCVQSMLPQLPGSGVCFNLFNFVSLGKKDLFHAIKLASESVVPVCPGSTYSEKQEDLDACLEAVLKELENRRVKAAAGETLVPRFLVVYQTENCKSLQAVETMDFLDRLTPSISETATKLRTIMSVGPELGVHCLLHFADPASFEAVFTDKGSELKLFNHVLALQMSEDESRHILGSSRPYAGRLYDRIAGEEAANNRAIYLNAYTGDIEKIKPYSFVI